MRSRLGRALARVDALGLRERGLVFLALLGALYLGCEKLLLGPLDARRAALETRIEALGDEVGQLHAQAGALLAARRADPDAENRSRLEALRAELARLDAALRDATGRLVPPERMGALLEAVLTRRTDLELVRLEGLGATAVAVAGDDLHDDGARPAALPLGSGAALYRHGLRMELEGSYLQALGYLNALEALPWRFLWDGVRLEVTEHPSARVAITVYSLSLEKDWIGI